MGWGNGHACWLRLHILGRAAASGRRVCMCRGVAARGQHPGRHQGVLLEVVGRRVAAVQAVFRPRIAARSSSPPPCACRSLALPQVWPRRPCRCRSRCRNGAWQRERLGLRRRLTSCVVGRARWGAVCAVAGTKPGRPQDARRKGGTVA